MRKPISRTTAIDAHVGARVRTRRTLLGLSQTTLGEAMGVSFQQVQKYERGANRISAGTLYKLGKLLDVPVSYFFEDMPADLGEAAQPVAPSAHDDSESDTMHKRETLELVRAYYRIEDDDVRRRLYEAVKELSGTRRRPRA